jgi:hypothetical protein
MTLIIPVVRGTYPRPPAPGSPAGDHPRRRSLFLLEKRGRIVALTAAFVNGASIDQPPTSADELPAPRGIARGFRTACPLPHAQTIWVAIGALIVRVAQPLGSLCVPRPLANRVEVSNVGPTPSIWPGTADEERMDEGRAHHGGSERP